MWGSGGGVEPNEDPREALVREIHEELGLTITIADLKIIGTMFRREHDNLVLVYEISTQLSSNDSFPLPAGELEEYTFVPTQSAKRLLARILKRKLVNAQ